MLGAESHSSNATGGSVPSQPHKKLKKTASAQQMELMWTVCNREDYTPTLYHPYGVTFLQDSTAIVVVEGFWPYGRLQLFDLSGRSLSTICQGEVLPFGVALDVQGDLVVTDHKDRTVKMFTRNGTLKLSWQQNMFDWPKGVARTVNDQFVITDWTRGEVCIHHADGTLIRKFKSYGTDISDYSCPEYVTTDNHGRIIITDTYDHSIKLFDETGKFLSKTHRATDEADLLRDPRGVCIDNDGHILVSDWGNNRVCQFDSSGTYIQDLLNTTEIRNPWGISAGPNNTFVLSEQKLNASPAVKLFQGK